VVLVLVRHGQSVLNAEGCLAGRVDTQLTQLGLAQAAEVGEAVRAVGTPDRVISSPLQRARDTATALGLPVTVDERWIELDYGPYDGLPLTDVPAELWLNWQRDVGWVPPGGESLLALGSRVRHACEEAIGADDELTVVVTHVSPIKAAVAWALGVGDEVSWRMYVAPASMTVIGQTDRGPLLRAFNITTHLDRLAPR
jgi:broad specificity phosphatase PhoE